MGRNDDTLKKRRFVTKISVSGDLEFEAASFGWKEKLRAEWKLWEAFWTVVYQSPLGVPTPAQRKPEE